MEPLIPADATRADRARFLRFAHQLADRARLFLKGLDPDERQVSLKADGSYVSAADKQIEALWREAITREFPDHGVVGEEYLAVGADSPWQWILDPIDGTDNYVHGLPTFGSLIALRYEDRPILGLIDHPALDLRLSAVEGLGAFCGGRLLRIRDEREAGLPILMVTAPENFAKGEGMDVFCRLAGAFPNMRIYRDCFAHSAVLQGQAAAMVDWNVQVWDVAAAEAIVKEAGGAYVRLPGGSAERYRVVFGRPQVVDAIVALIT